MKLSAAADDADPENAGDLTDLFDEFFRRCAVQIKQGIFHFSLGFTGHAGDVGVRAADNAGQTGDHLGLVLVEDTDPVAGLAHAEITVGIVDAVFDVAVLQVVGELLNGHDRAVVLGLLVGCVQVGDRDAAPAAGDGRVGEIRHIAADLARAQSQDDSLLVDQDVACHIDQDHACLHHRDRVVVDHPLCRGKRGHMDRDIVADIVDVLNADDMCDTAGQMPG